MKLILFSIIYLSSHLSLVGMNTKKWIIINDTKSTIAFDWDYKYAPRKHHSCDNQQIRIKSRHMIHPRLPDVYPNPYEYYVVFPNVNKTIVIPIDKYQQGRTTNNTHKEKITIKELTSGYTIQVEDVRFLYIPKENT